FASHMTKQRQVRDLARRQLEERDVERLEDIGARLVERRREENEPSLGRALRQLRQRVRSKLQAGEHVPLTLSPARGLELIARLGRLARQERVHAEGLELDGIGAAFGGGVHE